MPSPYATCGHLTTCPFQSTSVPVNQSTYSIFHTTWRFNDLTTWPFNDLTIQRSLTNKTVVGETTYFTYVIYILRRQADSLGAVQESGHSGSARYICGPDTLIALLLVGVRGLFMWEAESSKGKATVLGLDQANLLKLYLKEYKNILKTALYRSFWGQKAGDRLSSNESHKCLPT